MSSEIFQKQVDEALGDLPGVRCIADDIIVAGCGNDLHEATVSLNNRLSALLERCKERHIILNPDKLEHAVTPVPFIGHLLTSRGVQPDPDKVAAIKKMPVPTDVAAVLRFCGTVNYMAKFLPNLSSVIKPLAALTCQNTPWFWGPGHDYAVTTTEPGFAGDIGAIEV